MGNSLLCHYIDNCFKIGIILWGQKHCDWGAELRNGGHLPPIYIVKKGSGVIRSISFGNHCSSEENRCHTEFVLSLVKMNFLIRFLVFSFHLEMKPRSLINLDH